MLSLLLFFVACATSKPPKANLEALLQPRSMEQRQAPDQFRVLLSTTKGDLLLEIYREWAPLGVDRFHHLVSIGYYQNIAFFRAINGFMIQFGIHGNPEINAVWQSNRIKDDPVQSSNTTGVISFASAGPNTRTVQLFINTQDNSTLDRMGFAPFGKVIDMTPDTPGMEVLRSIYTGYGEGAPRGQGPSQGLLQSQGDAHLKKFPKLDYIHFARICKPFTAQNPCP